MDGGEINEITPSSQCQIQQDVNSASSSSSAVTTPASGIHRDILLLNCRETPPTDHTSGDDVVKNNENQSSLDNNCNEKEELTSSAAPVVDEESSSMSNVLMLDGISEEEPPLVLLDEISPYRFRCEGDSWEYILSPEEIEKINNGESPMIRLVEINGTIEPNPKQGKDGHDIIEIGTYVGMKCLLLETFRVSKGTIQIDYAMRAHFLSDQNSVCQRISVHMKRYGPTSSYCSCLLKSVKIKTFKIPELENIYPIQHCEINVIEEATTTLSSPLTRNTDDDGDGDNNKYDWLKGDLGENISSAEMIIDPFTTSVFTGSIMRFLTLADFCRLSETCRWIRHILSQSETWAYASGRTYLIDSPNIPLILDVSRWIVLWWKAALSFSTRWPIVPGRRRFTFDARQLVNNFVFPSMDVLSKGDNLGNNPSWDSSRLPLWRLFEDKLGQVDPSCKLEVKGWSGIPLPRNMRKYFNVRVVVGVSPMRDNFVEITTDKRPDFAPITRCGSIDGIAVGRMFRLCDEFGNIEIKFKSRNHSVSSTMDLLSCPYIEFFWTSPQQTRVE